LFLPFRVDAFEEFWREVVESRALEQVGQRIQGFTVASPNKEAAVKMLKARPGVPAVGFGEPRVPPGSGLGGDHHRPDRSAGQRRPADTPGAARSRHRLGGSGRAIASALSRAGAHVTLFNRSQERGEQASRLLGLPFAPLSRFSADGFDLIINATPVGTRGEALPFSLCGVAQHTIVVDLVYAQVRTPLVESARANGVRVVDGREVLLAQVERQFTRMTGLTPPLGLMAERLRLARGNRAG
jgi:shikimate 5-dehydrogenase